ncbi:MAG TPA: glycosyltransferase [Vicinamibacterales bacterium]
MLKVLHVGKFYPPVPGGIERVVESLCQATRGRLDSRVLAFNTTARTAHDVVDGIPVTRVGRWGTAGSVAVAPSLAAHIRRARADVMILHEPNPWALLSFAIARPRVPLAIWFHSEVVRPQLQYDLFYSPIARPAYGSARRFVVSSPDLAEHSETLAQYRDRVTVIPFGIDVDRWRPTDRVRRRAAEIREASTRPLVVFAGRHVAYKGVDVLIEAAAGLDVTVAILGDGPMRADWMALARRHSTPTFIFRGEVSDEELHAHLAAARMLVLPSVTRAETFGFVQLEAMACGVPVISTRLPTGVPWVNRTGLIVEPGDVAGLRGAIVRLAADPAAASAIGAAGAARARAEFSLAAMGDRLVELCAEIASTAAPHTAGAEASPSNAVGKRLGAR